MEFAHMVMSLLLYLAILFLACMIASNLLLKYSGAILCAHCYKKIEEYAKKYNSNTKT